MVGKGSGFLFRVSDGSITDPSSDYRSTVENYLKNVCAIITTGQRYSERFVLRQFRITGKNSCSIMLHESRVREAQLVHQIHQPLWNRKHYVISFHFCKRPVSVEIGAQKR